MMIGILTHCIANNFGANLQALSTAMYLKNRGYTPFFFFWDEYLKKRSIKMDERQLNIHRNFLVSHGIQVSKPCTLPEDFARVIKENDIKNIIVGSDAVLTVNSWFDKIHVGRKGVSFNNTTADKVFPNPFWIPFANLVPECHFFYVSPSCQSTNYNLFSKSLLERMKRQIEKFDFLCARDRCTKEMMEFILGKGVNVPITPDPVWGFLSNLPAIPEKDSIIKKYGLQKDYILTSFYRGSSISSVWLDSFRLFANKDKIEVYSLPMPQGHFNSNLPKINLPIDPIDWFALIRYSKGYVGNNMHPIIVSMHNRVPFYSIDQHGKYFLHIQFDKSSKVYDLLENMGLQDFRIKQQIWKSISPQEVYDKLKNFPIDRLNEVAQKKEKDYMSMMYTICNKFIS